MSNAARSPKVRSLVVVCMLGAATVATTTLVVKSATPGSLSPSAATCPQSNASMSAILALSAELYASTARLPGAAKHDARARSAAACVRRVVAD